MGHCPGERTLVAAQLAALALSITLTGYSAGARAQSRVVTASPPPPPERGLVTPTRPSPEQQAGCTIPTLRDCQSATYIATRCGQLQMDNEWTCARLIQDGMTDLADAAEVDAVAAEMWQSGGVARSIAGGSAETASEYRADPASISSGYYAAEHGEGMPPGEGAPGQLTIADPYDQWAESTNFMSCNEYVYEQFYQTQEMLRALGPEGRDPHRFMEVVFGPEGDPASFGTQHLSNLIVRALDGSATVALSYGGDDKNAFFWLPANQSTSDIVDEGPDLHKSLRVFSSLADAYLETIEASRADDDPGSHHYETTVYPGNLTHDLWFWENVVADGPTPAAVAHPDFDLYFNPDPSPPPDLAPEDDFAAADDGLPPTARELLGSVSSYPSLRRYLLAELEELHDMQARVRELAHRWYAVTRRFPNSNWSPATLAGQGPGGGDGSFTIGLPGGHPDPDPSPLFLLNPQAGGQLGLSNGGGGVGTNGAGAGGGGMLSIGDHAVETALRRAILVELVQLLAHGSEAGCLEAGITPCDWSPSKLRERVLRSLDREREEAHRFCQRLVDGIWQHAELIEDAVWQGPEPVPTNGLMMNMIGRTYWFPESGGCYVEVPSELTQDDLTELWSEVTVCRAEQARIEEEQALAAVQESTDLYDAATGEFHNPGFLRTGGERMGNDWFALEYAYTYGWELDFRRGVCSAEAYAGAEFSAGVQVLARFGGEPRSLIDLAARVDTDDETNEGDLVDIHASVLGNALFTAIEVEDPGLGGGAASFSAVREADAEFDAPPIVVPFVIVFVPVSISAGVSAQLGVRSSLEGEIVGFGDDGQCPQISIGGEIEPFVRARGFIAAQIELFIARAGIRGELTIIDAGVPFRPSLRLAIDDSSPLEGGMLEADLTLYVDTRADLRLSTLDGSIAAFAEVGWCPVCARASIDIIDWNGPSWDIPLYSESYVIPLADLAIAFPEQ